MYLRRTAPVVFAAATLTAVLRQIDPPAISYCLLLAGLLLLGVCLFIEGGSKLNSFTSYLFAGVSMYGVSQHPIESIWRQGLTTGSLLLLAAITIVGFTVAAKTKTNEKLRSVAWVTAMFCGIVIPTLWFGNIAMGHAGVILALSLYGIATTTVVIYWWFTPAEESPVQEEEQV